MGVSFTVEGSDLSQSRPTGPSLSHGNANGTRNERQPTPVRVPWMGQRYPAGLATSVS